MSYTLSGIRQRVMIDKLDDDEYDTSVVDNFINDTQRDIFTEYELSFMEKIYSGTVPEGVTIFAMPTDVSIIQAQVITGPDGTQRDLQDYYIPFREFIKRYPTPANNEPGEPYWWTSYAGKMLLSRPTDADYVMDIFYVKKPVDLTGENDVPDIPAEFEELMVLGAFARIQDREGDQDEAIVTKSQFDKKMLQLVSRYGFRRADGPLRMKNRQVKRNANV